MSQRYRLTCLLTFWALACKIVNLANAQTTQAALAHPILFVTQVPIPGDFTTIASVFGNHRGSMESVGRGGDLYVLYPDGSLKNLTQAAGYGESGLQGEKSIAVREPSMHWDGKKAVFSMVPGAPKLYEVKEYYWQLYEITGLGKNEAPVINKVANQPTQYNNVSPIYGGDDRILFVSDRPRNGQRHLYPQDDEYESAPTNTGLWSLDPTNGNLYMLNHAPSGSFTPMLDSFGRVVFTRWDHLQRDQQADADAQGGNTYGTFNYASEAANAMRRNNRDEVFPEPRASRTDLLQGTNLVGHSFNDFFPWQINEDGTEEETINHIGRHELHGYFNRSMNDDPNLREFIPSGARPNQNNITNFIQMKEDPTRPGYYFGVDAPEFFTHAAGQIIGMEAAPVSNPDNAKIDYLTHRDTHSFADSLSPNHSGLYRNPLPLADGTLISIHTSSTREDRNEGTRAAPKSRYQFRLKTLKQANGYWVADKALTPGVTKSVSYYDPDVLVSYSGELWELDPVEVRSRTRPTRRAPKLEAPEQQVLLEENIDVARLVTYLKQNNLALVVSRNITTRDKADRQQPFNLRVAGTNTKTTGAAGKLYDVAHMQFFQGDQIRGKGGTTNPRAGRRVLAQAMHDNNLNNPPNAGGPQGSVKIANDGSMAAFVPARRAMTWQLTDATGTPVVRERYWLTFQPGEIRTCASCHGLNAKDQAGNTVPTNKPEALRQLMRHYKTLTAVAENETEQRAPVADYQLLGNQPNPLSHTTRLRLQINKSSHASRLVIYDVTGRIIWQRELQTLSAGTHEIMWEGKDSAGRLVANGTYFYRVENGLEKSPSRTMVVVR